MTIEQLVSFMHLSTTTFQVTLFSLWNFPSEKLYYYSSRFSYLFFYKSDEYLSSKIVHGNTVVNSVCSLSTSIRWIILKWVFQIVEYIYIYIYLCTHIHIYTHICVYIYTSVISAAIKIVKYSTGVSNKNQWHFQLYLKTLCWQWLKRLERVRRHWHH